MIANLLVAIGELFVNEKATYDFSMNKSLRPLKKTMHHFMFLVQKNIQEYRTAYLIKYPLDEIIILVFLAVAHGAETYNEIESFGRIKIKFLQMFGGFKNGTPSHDTIRRTLMMVNENELEKTLITYVMSALKKARKYYERKGLLKHIVIDGKSLNGSGRLPDSDREIPNNGIVNVYDTGTQITIASATYNYKEKEATELTVARSLLSQLNLKNSICSLDALHFHRDIMKQIVVSKGHFVIGLKGNQPILFEDVKLYFASIEKKIKEGSKGYYLKELEKSHNQVETREWFVFPAVKYLKDDDWGAIKTFVCLKKTSYDLTKEEYKEPEYHYYASSLNDKQYSSLLPVIIRNHWQVENNLHWHLDVSMSEDDSQIAHIKASHNFSTIRKNALVFLKLLKKISKGSLGIKSMRKELGWGPDIIMTRLFEALNNDELLKQLSSE